MHMGVVLIGPGRWLSSMEGALASKILAAAPSMRTLNFLLYALTETSAVNDALQPLGIHVNSVPIKMTQPADMIAAVRKVTQRDRCE